MNVIYKSIMLSHMKISRFQEPKAISDLLFQRGFVLISSSKAAKGATEPTLPTHVRFVYHLLVGRR